MVEHDHLCLGGSLGYFPAPNPEQWEAWPSRGQQGKLGHGSGYMFPKLGLLQELNNKHKLNTST